MLRQSQRTQSSPWALTMEEYRGLGWHFVRAHSFFLHNRATFLKPKCRVRKIQSTSYPGRDKARYGQLMDSSSLHRLTLLFSPIWSGRASCQDMGNLEVCLRHVLYCCPFGLCKYPKYRDEQTRLATPWKRPRSGTNYVDAQTMFMQTLRKAKLLLNYPLSRNLTTLKSTKSKTILSAFQAPGSERWALPTTKKAKAIRIKGASTTWMLLRRCQLWAVIHKQNQKSSSTPQDMYQFSACHRIYHWQCLFDLECYTDAQQQDVIDDDGWTSPACEHLIPAQTMESAKNIRARVHLEPIWEPKELLNARESLKENVLECEFQM